MVMMMSRIADTPFRLLSTLTSFTSLMVIMIMIVYL